MKLLGATIDIKPQRFLALVPAAMLVLALSRQPYGYYQLLRIVVCVSAAGIASGTSEEGVSRAPGWKLVFVIIALAFNPIVPMRLRRETWLVLDVAAAGVFACFAATALARRREPTSSSVQNSTPQ
jgi:uncharacterized protein DUF6804